MPWGRPKKDDVREGIKVMYLGTRELIRCLIILMFLFPAVFFSTNLFAGEERASAAGPTTRHAIMREKTMITADQRQTVAAVKPPLDLRVPARVETATFALG